MANDDTQPRDEGATTPNPAGTSDNRADAALTHDEIFRKYTLGTGVILVFDLERDWKVVSVAHWMHNCSYLTSI